MCIRDSFRDQYPAQPTTNRGKELFLESADRQYFATQGNLAGHRDIATYRLSLIHI